MRDRAPIRHVDYFWWSFWIFIGAFLVQNILGVWFGLGNFLYGWFAMSPDNVASGKVWTIFTYSLMHRDLGHFFGNGIGLFFIGRWLAREIPPKQYLHIIFGSIFMGGLVWLIIHAILGNPIAPLVGFSAAVLGMLTATCLMWPHGKITLLIFFVLPVEFKPRVLLKVVLALEVLGFVFIELAMMLGYPPILNGISTAFSAHLGGALAGYLFYRLQQRTTPLFESVGKSVSVEAPKWRKKRAPAKTGKFKVNVRDRKDLRREVDRILDKINKEGFQSLSPEEQKVLDDAGDLLKK